MVEDMGAQLLFHPGSQRGALFGIGSVNEIHAGFVQRDRVKRGEDADVRHLGLRRMSVAVAVDGDVVHDADIDRAVSHEIDDRAGGLGHGFDEVLLRSLPYFRPHLV